MDKYTKEGSKIPNKEYSIKLNNKGSIRYITPEQSEKLNNNTLIDFLHSHTNSPSTGSGSVG